jgi:hypothetical protein
MESPLHYSEALLILHQDLRRPRRRFPNIRLNFVQLISEAVRMNELLEADPEGKKGD